MACPGKERGGVTGQEDAHARSRTHGQFIPPAWKVQL